MQFFRWVKGEFLFYIWIGIFWNYSLLIIFYFIKFFSYFKVDEKKSEFLDNQLTCQGKHRRWGKSPSPNYIITYIPIRWCRLTIKKLFWAESLACACQAKKLFSLSLYRLSCCFSSCYGSVYISPQQSSSSSSASHPGKPNHSRCPSLSNHIISSVKSRSDPRVENGETLLARPLDPAAASYLGLLGYKQEFCTDRLRWATRKIIIIIIIITPIFVLYAPAPIDSQSDKASDLIL